MKEFASQTGGRFTYVDDFLNLQELALVFGEIFTGCDNFIISGCEVSGNSISQGLVYLNGKIRTVEAVAEITGGWPQYIYEVNEYKNVPYASGGEKVGRAIWGAKIGKTVPLTNTPLTDVPPKAIQLNANGGLQMKDAWIGKYALILNPEADEQTVKGSVNFDKLNIANSITGASKYILDTPGGVCSLYFVGSNLVLERKSGNKTTQLIMDDDAVIVQVNNEEIATISSESIAFAKPFVAKSSCFGNIKIENDSIYNYSTTSDTGALNINLFGQDGSNKYFRSTIIGDGKGRQIVTVTGSKGAVDISGSLTINGSTSPLVLKASQKKSSTTLQSKIVWKDSEDNDIAQIGFADQTSSTLTFDNGLGDVNITGLNYVNIGPQIKEGGVALSMKYAAKVDMTEALNKKANAEDVYAKVDTYSTIQANDKFASKSAGFTQFITGTNTQSVLCSQIGALQTSDLSDYVKKGDYLADMATSDAAKAKIRQNIGAAASTDIQKDTGWIRISNTNIYVRQIGDIVSIQGTLVTMHEGVVFTLPNSIVAPRYSVGYDAPMLDSCHWGCEIAAGQKVCRVRDCGHHNMTVPISITYMV